MHTVHEDTITGDWELVRRAQGGDRDAFGVLFERHRAAVHKFLFGKTWHHQTAEDLTADTFVRALRRLDSVKYEGREFQCWLITIARNLFLDMVKSLRYRTEMVTVDPAHWDYIGEQPGDDRVGDEIEAKETADLLWRKVATLTLDQQECVRHRFVDGLSTADTAVLMQRPNGAVKALQYRAKERLADLIPRELVR